MRVTYNKLVRDRIPEIIQAHGDRAVTHILDGESYRTALLAKLMEEAREAQDASADELPEELADVLEVLRALTSSLGMTWEQILALTTDKCTERGAFEERLFLEFVEQAE
jgi:predicted house-cleaning noncanonical NTP pyrophosphatase (MazG superfamily)